MTIRLIDLLVEALSKLNMFIYYRSFQCSECRQEWVSRKVFWCGRCRTKEKECGCVTMTWSQERVRQVVCRQDRAQHDKVSSSLM